MVGTWSCRKSPLISLDGIGLRLPMKNYRLADPCRERICAYVAFTVSILFMLMSRCFRVQFPTDSLSMFISLFARRFDVA
jgi:hypothetical protein